MTILPRQLFKDYGENFKKLGHIEAMRILRMRIVAKYGHAWYMSNKARIERETASIEERVGISRDGNG